MRTKSIAALLLGFALFAGTATSSVATPITFNFIFFGSGARATGSITFESTLLPNPGVGDFLLPNPAVLALTVTVASETTGSGTFGIESFDEVIWYTGDAKLDLGRQLVGQPTGHGHLFLWGADPLAGCNGQGDFDLIAKAPPAPTAGDCLALNYDGDLEADRRMFLMSMVPPVTAELFVPALDAGKLAVLALLVGGAGIALIRRRRLVRPSV